MIIGILAATRIIPKFSPDDTPRNHAFALFWIFGALSGIWLLITVWDLFQVDPICKQGWQGVTYMTYLVMLFLSCVPAVMTAFLGILLVIYCLYWLGERIYEKCTGEILDEGQFIPIPDHRVSEAELNARRNAFDLVAERVRNGNVEN
jgi:hypothetical protein